MALHVTLILPHTPSRLLIISTAAKGHCHSSVNVSFLGHFLKPFLGRTFSFPRSILLQRIHSWWKTKHLDKTILRTDMERNPEILNHKILIEIMTIKLKPCQRRNLTVLKSHDYWGGSTSMSLPVFLTVVLGFKTAAGWAQGMKWNRSKSYKSISSGQSQNTPLLCGCVFRVDLPCEERITRSAQGGHAGSGR